MATKKKKKSYIDQVLSGEYEYTLVNMNKTSSKKTSTNKTTSSNKNTTGKKSYTEQVLSGEYEYTLFNKAQKQKEERELKKQSQVSSFTNNALTRTSQKISSFLLGKDDEEDIAPVKPTVTTPSYTTNEDGYTLIGKSYGDYFYEDYVNMKDYPIVQKDGNFYILNPNAKKPEEKYLAFAPRGSTMPVMTTQEIKDKEYEEAVRNGYVNRNQTHGLSSYDLVKLDSADLTPNERKEYTKDLKRQQKEEDEEADRKNKIRYGGAGLKGTLGELEYYWDNLTENVDEEVVDPIKNAPESYKMGKMSEELGLEAYKSMMGEENNYEELKKEYDKYAMFNQDIATDDSMISQSIQSMPNQWGGFKEGVKGGGVGSIIGGILGGGVGYFTGNTGKGALLGAKYGGGAGYTVGQMEYTYKLEAGLQYQTLIEMGVPEDIAKEEAQKVGTANALIEGGESLLDLVTLGRASAGKELLKQGLLKKYGLETVESWALNTVVVNPLSEGLEEGLQEKSSIEGEKRATKKAGIERDDSQDAERIWDSAKVGAFSGLMFGGATAITTKGVSAGVNKVTSNKTTYTQNEQAVIDKEVENRVAEAEKNGKELTTKEKNEIKAEVIEDLENGYISTDSIENTLGGDTYTSLNEIRNNKTKIEQEINELENKPYAQLTVKENDRLKALREELSAIDTNTLETQLRSEMDGKIANDNRLQRSYVEKYNRSQKFTRNESEKSDNANINDFYTSMEEANVNNTKKTHDFTSFVSNIIKDKGIKARAVNYDILVKEGRIYKDTDGQYKFIENGKKTDRVANINGFKENGVLNINMQSSKAFEMTVGHELGEFIKDSDSTAYEQLKNIAIELGKADGSYSEGTLESYIKAYGELTDDATDEYVNDKLGELFDNDQFVTRISENRSLLRKIIDELKYLVEYATAGSSEKRKLISLQHKLENKFREVYKKTDLTKESSEDTRYSIGGLKGVNNLKNREYVQEFLEDYDKAIKFKEAGKDNEFIRTNTGWFQDKNGDWKIEFSDKQMKVKDVSNIKVGKEYNLSEILDHKLLYEFYPELKTYKVKFKNFDSKNIILKLLGKGQNYKKRGSYQHETHTVSLNKHFLDTKELQETLKLTVIHELQHAIQRIEGFEHGRPAWLSKERYFKSLGEIEATNTSKRIDMDMEQRLKEAPESSKADPKHPRYDTYMEKRGTIDKLKDSLYTYFEEAIDDKILKKLGIKFKDNDIGVGEYGDSGRYGLADNSNQEKGLDNSSFFNGDNTRYSLDTEGKLVDSEGNGVTLEAGETGTTGNLLAIQGLSPENLKRVLSLGGFPVPSIAVTQSSNASVIEEFGGSEGITVVFDKNTIDPKTKANEVYSNDVYSKTIPQVYQKVDNKSLKKVLEEFRPYESEYGSLNKHDYSKSSLESIVNDLSYQAAVKAKFLEDNGYGIKKVYKDFRSGYYSFTAEEIENFKKKYPDLASLNEYSVDISTADQIREITLDMMAESDPQVPRETFAKLFKEKFYLNDVIKFYRDIKQYDNANKGQEFDSYATRDNIDKAVKEHQEEFNQWLTSKFESLYGDKYFENEKGRKYDYTLENLTSYMKKGSTKTQQKGMFDTFGVGQAKASASRKFKSLDQIRTESKNLVDAETYNERRKAFEDIDDDVRTEIGSERISNGEGVFEVYSDYYMALAEAASKNVTAEEALNHNWFKNVTKEQIDKFDIVKEQLKKFPAKYFEAKPQRTVGLNEIQALVVPNTLESTFKQQLIDNGYNVVEYDPTVEGDRTAKINELDDLKFSLGIGNEVAPTNPNLTYAEDVRLEVEEAIAPLKQEIAELKETLAPVQKQVEYTQPTKEELDNLMSLQETGGTEYANTFFELRDKYGQANLYKGINQYKKAPDTYTAPIKGEQIDTVVNGKAVTEAELPMLEQQYEEDFKHIDESNIPAETEEIAPIDAEPITTTKSLFETRDYENVGNPKTKAYMYENPEVKPFFQQEAQYMLNDLKNSTKGEKWYNDDLYYETSGEQGYFGTTRQTTDDIAELLDGMDGRFKYTREQIEKGLNAIIKDEGSENNAVSKRIEFYLDQRLRNGYTNIDGIDIPANPEYISMLEEKQVTEYSDQAYQEWLKTLEDVDMPVENIDNSIDEIAPIKKPRETIAEIRPSKTRADDHGYELLKVKDISKEQKATNEEIAEILDKEPTTESDRNKRKWAIFKASVFDKGAVIEDLSLKKKNRELMGKWDFTLTSEARGQNIIGKGHFRFDPATKQKVQTSKSLNDIVQEVGNTGLTKQFYEYMYHKHNIDRMTLEERFGTENKAVIGDSVTAQESRKVVSRYETQHPEFMDFAQDVYDYLNADKQELVDNGVISQEASDLWQEMYPHYVPIRRVTDKGLDINVPLDTGRTGINAPVKQATGGNADILPLFDTMAMRTLQTQRATAKNSFGIELKNTLGADTVITTPTVDEVIDSIDAQEELLQEGKKGAKPTFTVFENGEKVTFTITKDMYDAMKPLSDSSILSKTIKPLNMAGNFHRGILTEYNPVFMLTNAIKDTQDVFLNSQHSARTYVNIPEALMQIKKKGYWYQEYVANGGEQNSYFDSQENTFKPETKGFKKTITTPFRWISTVNNLIEMTPRLAEYMASRKQGKSVEVSMLDASRVTTNFKAGGDLTKFLNRNGATFLNASVQGGLQQIRNIREANANGFKGWVKLASKFALAGVPALILNNLVWEDDEEYEELSDYVKQNYYVVGKYGDGKFIRIPKGRTTAVIQEAFVQMDNLITGNDEADFESFFNLVITNLAPNNPIEDNVFAPIIQVANNKTWYGEDLVPTRLQDNPVELQYDESTDMFSRWLGETFGVSPYKVNYLLDQYSGGLGDVFLPMMTPEAESGDDKFIDKLFAPVKSKFTTDSVMNNQNVSDFYEKSEELTIQANKTNATDEDILRNKYMNSVKAEMNELYAEKREIQNSNLPDSEKYRQVREKQKEINNLSKNALSEYDNARIYDNYAQVGDRHYRINGSGDWTKINDKQLAKQERMTTALNINGSDYWRYNDEIYDIKADKDSNGESISGSRKKKVLNYINNLELDEVQKAILFKMEYPSYDDHNYAIINYVNNLNLSYEDKVSILTELDMEVDKNGNIRW